MIDLSTALKVFWSSTPQNVHEIEVIRLSHSQMSQDYYLWQEPYVGNVTNELAASVTVIGVNMAIKPSGTEANLDQKYAISIDTADSLDIFRNEMDAIDLTTTEAIKCTYYLYLSNDLTTIQGIANLQVLQAQFVKPVFNITAISPRYNVGGTGDVYNVRQIPMLRGFL